MIIIKARDGGIRALSFLTISLVILIPNSTLAQSDVSILYHEPLEMRTIEYQDDGPTARMTFDAFGRRFVLLVEESAPGVSGPDVELIKARIADMPDSWARLTVRNGVVSGLIHDPYDTYVIESRRTLSGTLIVSNYGETSASIIYRLSDTLVAPGLLSCDTHDDGEHINGKAAMAELTAELDVSTTLETTDGDHRATVGVLADSSFSERLGDDTRMAIEDIFLTVGGIFSEQLGVELEATSVTVSTAPEQDPVSTQRNGSALLDELGAWRIANQPHLSITHLLTNRGLLNDNNKSIAGISFLGAAGRSGVCDRRTGASISEWMGGGLTALIVAHEIGHNFGAQHDGEISAPGETPNACASELSDDYLMSPVLRGTRNNEFSQCSIEKMQQVIAAATCLRPGFQQATAIVAGDGGGGSAIHWATALILMMLSMSRRRRRPRHVQEIRIM